jgi:hypothetical protein
VDIDKTSVSSAPYARCLEVRHPAGELAGELVSASAKTEWSLHQRRTSWGDQLEQFPRGQKRPTINRIKISRQKLRTSQSMKREETGQPKLIGEFIHDLSDSDFALDEATSTGSN